MKIKFDSKTIEISKTFADKASHFGSMEYHELRAAMCDLPNFTVAIKTSPKSEAKEAGKCHRGSLRYPTIKKWFLDKYPEVAKFGMVNEEEAKGEEAKDEEANSQNAIPFPAAKTSDEAATAEAKKVG